MEEKAGAGKTPEDELDRLLRRNFGPPHAHASERESLEPSSGFAGAVMERVRAEAATAGPILFPWRRAIPGICMAALGVVVGLILLGVAVTTGSRLLSAAVMAAVTAAPPVAWAQTVSQMHLGWLAAGLMIALVPLGVTRLWTGHRR